MKRLVLGILIVFCVQVGFIAYTAVDRQFGTLAAVNEVTVGTNPIADLSDIPNAIFLLNADAEQGGNNKNEEITVSYAEKTRGRRPSGAILASHKRVVRPAVTRAVNRLASFVAIQKPLEPGLVIEYPAPAISNHRESENYQVSVRDVPRSEKKSFAAKSFSVIKKPYDWLKALGSKIR